MIFSSSPSSSSLKILLVTGIALSVIAMVTGGYLGPRYGKRLPSGGGDRTIQSRSQSRFYAGSRYGGKRSYWSNPHFSDIVDNSEQNSPSSPSYDCFFVPYLGVRCAVKSEDNDSNDYASPSMIRTTMIESGGGNSDPSGAVQAVMGSEA